MTDKKDEAESPEIIVTPEMIKAGLVVLAGFNEWDQARQTVVEIFRAMSRAFQRPDEDVGGRRRLPSDAEAHQERFFARGRRSTKTLNSQTPGE